MGLRPIYARRTPVQKGPGVTKAFDATSFAKVLIQAETVVRFNDDVVVLGVNDEPHRGLPLIGDRKFHLLVDVAFQEARPYAGLKPFSVKGRSPHP